MTEIEALEACIKVWSSLHRTGNQKKPKWAHKTYVNGCPCCSYAQQEMERERTDRLLRVSCNFCPVWCKPDTLRAFQDGCEGDLSYYWKWDGEERKEWRKRYAGMIIKEARRRLALLQ